MMWMRVLHVQLAWLMLRAMCLAVVLGCLGGASAHAFRLGLDYVGAALFRQDGDVSIVIAMMPWTLQLAIPTIGGAIAGLVLWYAMRREGPGATSADYLDAIDGRTSYIPVWPSLLRCVSSFFSIVSGSSVGREGAMVQLSATVGSICSRMLTSISGERIQLAVAMAATGGLAAVYQTPLAAAIFVAEIALGGIDFRRLALLFTAAVAATWMNMTLGHEGPMYALPPHDFVLNGGMLAMLALVGIACGLAGTSMLVAINWARAGFSRLPGGIISRMTCGGLLVGVVILFAPEVAGNGFAPIVSLLHNQPLMTGLAVLLLLKIIATAVTVGSGAVGGLFTPALMIGALTGAGCAMLVADVLPGDSNVLLFSVVGMAAALAATTQAPLMATLMVFEMTQDAQLIFPIMLATVLAYGTAVAMGQTGTYAIIARHRERFTSRSRLSQATVGTAMVPLLRAVTPDDSVSTALHHASVDRNRYVFVVEQSGHYVGAISVHDLLAQADQTLPLSACDLLSTEVRTLEPQQRLRDVWEKVADSPAERIPVLAPDTGVVLGILLKSDVLKRARQLLA